MGKKYLETKTGSLEQSILGLWERAAAKIKETNKNDKSDDGEGLDAVQKDAVKKKFKDRKDKDIDNDGDTDSSDKFLHKRRKAISKNVADSESVDYAELHNEINTSKTKNTREMWEDAVKQVHENAKVKKEQDDVEDEPKKKGKKTDTGKRPDVIDIDPDVDETEPK